MKRVIRFLVVVTLFYFVLDHFLLSNEDVAATADNIRAGIYALNEVIAQENDDDKPDFIPGKGAAKVTCAKGTRDIGLYNGYIKGVSTQIRLCALTLVYSSSEESHGGFGVKGAKNQALVSSVVSSNYSRMIRAARADGIKLSATSSFRTYNHQKQLWNSLGRNRAIVARPGYSKHQQGAAVDFAFAGVYNTTANCRWTGGFCTLRGHRTWDWLNANARKYGIYQYSGEFWHFSPTGH